MDRPPSSSRSAYRPHLDGIRALAVAAVIAFHLGFPGITGGFVGVDVFFVLSGYLITGLLLREADGTGTVGLGRFYARRVRRLLPAAVLVLLTTIAAGHWLLDAVQRHTLGVDTLWSTLYGANWRFATVGGDYFAPGDVPSALVHFWSLAVEEQFYLVWPAAFLVLHRLARRRGGGTGPVLGATLALVAASATASVLTAGSPVAYYGTHVRAYQLLAGAALALAVAWWRERRPAAVAPGPAAGATRATRLAAGLAGPVLVGGSLAWLWHLATTIPDATRYPGRPGLAVTAASTALVGGLDLTRPGLHTRLLGCRPLAAVGRWSYSLYVWHWPIIVFLPLVAERWQRPGLDDRPVALALLAVVAGASYLLVERPVRYGLAPRAPSRRVVGLALGTSLTCALVATVVFPPLSGFQRRALASVGDMAEVGDCPYSPAEWAEPGADQPCVWRHGGPGAPTYALVGDSQAHMWEAAVDELAARTDATVVRVTRRSCPANDVTTYRGTPDLRTYTDVPCTEWRHDLYPKLVRQVDPDVTFVATRSHVLGIADGDRQLAPGTPEHLAAWSAGWDWTLRTLLAGSGTVVLSAAMPTMAVPTPTCLVEHGRDAPACDMPLADDPAIAGPNAVLRSLPARFPGLAVVDPAQIVCPDGSCPAMMDGDIVHRDDNHLSATWVRHHADDLGRLFAAAGVRIG